MPTPSRAAFIIVNMARMPLCGSPTSQPVGAVEVDARRSAERLDAHLVLDRAAADAVALAEAAVVAGEELRHQEQADAARAGGRVGQPREHEMHDVLGQVVLAGGDEDLGAGDPVAAVRRRLGAGADQAEIGAALRLGEAHRAGPAAVDELRQVARFSTSRCRAARAAR